MKKLIPAFVFLLAPTEAYADNCAERFAELFINGNPDTPVKIRAVQEIKGGMKTVSDFMQIGTGHWMTQMIDPANMQWTLTYNNKMYSSADQGNSWSLVRELDSEQQNDDARKNREKDAETIQNAVCGEEELDGVMHETVQADFETRQNFKSQNTYKYWINPDTGWIAKATYDTKASSFESFTTQHIEKAPGLELPMPQ